MRQMRPSWAGREAEAAAVSIHGAQTNKTVSDKIELQDDLTAVSKGHRKRRWENGFC